MEGKKLDKGKTRFDLLDPKFVEAMAKVMTMGADKYAPDNWKNVDDFRARYTAALHRHLSAWQCGRVNDKESRLNHLAHVAVNAMFLAWRDNEDTNVRRRRRRTNSVNERTRKTGSGGDEINDVEAISGTEGNKRRVPRFPD